KAYRAAPVRRGGHGDTAPDAAGGGEGGGELYSGGAGVEPPRGEDSGGGGRPGAARGARGAVGGAPGGGGRGAGGAGAPGAGAGGVRVGRREVEEWAAAAAKDVDAFYAARRPQPCPDRVLMLQADGKGIVMRPDGLRPATAAQAAKTQAKLTTRLSPGEKHGRKRMAEIFAVGDVEPPPRTV